MGGPALTKIRAGRWGPPPPQKNVSLRGAGVDLPECQERRRGKHKSTPRGPGLTFPNVKNDAGKHKSTKKSVLFLKASPAGRSNVHILALWLSCETPAASGPPWLAHDSPRTPNVHIRAPRRFKHHQNSTRRPPERHKKSEMVAGEGKKRAKFWLPHPFGPPPFGPPPFGPPTLRAPPFEPHPSGPHPPGLCFSGLAPT